VKKPAVFLTINRYKVSIIVLLVLIISLASITLLQNKKTIQSVISIIKIKPLDNKVIVIDPGHGGIDGGTNIGDILEKNINLEVGLKLKDMLSKKGATVIMTREIDESLDDRIVGNGSRHREDLNARVKTVNDSKADLFISIHVNHIKNEKKIGPIVFYDVDSEEGKYLAEHMQEYLNDISTYKKHDINVKHGATSGNFYILGNIAIPGIIIEMGFLSNEIDRMLLLEAEHQDEIVEQITKSIIEFFIKEDDPLSIKLQGS